MSNVIISQALRSAQDAVIVVRHLGCKAFEGVALLVAYLSGVVHVQKLGRSKAAVAVFVAVLVLACALWLEMDDVAGADSTCPAPKARSRSSPGAPTELLAKAEAAAAEEVSTREELLRQCADWTPRREIGAAAPAVPAMEEVRAQLQCQERLFALASASDSPAARATEGEALLARSRVALGVVRGITQRCEDLSTKLSVLGREKNAARKKPSDQLVALGGLAGFEGIARETSATLRTLQGIAKLQLQEVEKQEEEEEEELDFGSEFEFLRRSFVGCALKAAKEARALAHGLPAQHPAVARVQRCKPEMLLGFEQLALGMASAATETDGQLLLVAGLVLSERSTAPSTVPFFGANGGKSTETMLDDHGALVQSDVVQAERLLRRGLGAVAAVEEQKDYSKQVLMRLAKHAKMLAELKEYVGAEDRYRDAAALAKKHGHQQLAASALAQLSYFLSLHSRFEEALDAASEALTFSSDALATYLQATLRLSLGELRTEEQVQAAAEQLRQIAGKLPAEHLEAARTSTLSKLDAWQEVSDAGTFMACLKFGDAAFLLSCFLGKFTYN